MLICTRYRYPLAEAQAPGYMEMQGPGPLMPVQPTR